MTIYVVVGEKSGEAAVNDEARVAIDDMTMLCYHPKTNISAPRAALSGFIFQLYLLIDKMLSITSNL